jgi:hypothetical protein
MCPTDACAGSDSPTAAPNEARDCGFFQVDASFFTGYRRSIRARKSAPLASQSSRGYGISTRDAAHHRGGSPTGRGKVHVGLRADGRCVRCIADLSGARLGGSRCARTSTCVRCHRDSDRPGDTAFKRMLRTGAREVAMRTVVVGILVVAFGAIGLAQSQQPEHVEKPDNYYAAGNRVEIMRPMDGDVVVAGRDQHQSRCRRRRVGGRMARGIVCARGRRRAHGRHMRRLPKVP